MMTGLVDFVLPVARIPQVLIAHPAAQKLIAAPRQGIAPDGDSPPWLGEVIDLLRTQNRA